MIRIPQGVRCVLQDGAAEFAESVWPRFQMLMLAAIVCVGRHTLCRLLHIAGALADGHCCSVHRALSSRRWSSWRPAQILAQAVVDRFLPRGTIPICPDLRQRHGHATSREEGLWQRAASRRHTLDAFLHGLAVRRWRCGSRNCRKANAESRPSAGRGPGRRR